MFVERVWIESGDKLGGASVRGGQAVQDGRVLRRRRTHAKVVEDANEAFEAAVHGHYFADTGRSGREISEMRE
jgi:hypothetical protein